MRISRVKIKNYRNIKDLDITLKNIVTLIGENNSGKSNFLRALAIPLSSDDTGINKRLSWYDLNKKSKEEYYNYIENKKEAIIDGKITPEDISPYLPFIRINLFIEPEENEHYHVRDILCEDEFDNWVGGIEYYFYIDKKEELLERIRTILLKEEDLSNARMSLLPMELFTYSLKVPGKNKKISYETLSNFRAVVLPAERDNFSSNADKLGSKALSNLLHKGLTTESLLKIEKKYSEFFDVVKTEGKMDSILNWQEYSEVSNAKDFFQEISVLPNMPQISSILGSVRLGYEEENMFTQGLGHRNLILMTVILNSYLNKDRDISFRLVTVEEPEAHLCNSNILLMSSFFNVFSKNNKYTQIVYSTHSPEFVNKIGIDKVIVFNNGEAYNLDNELNIIERDYLVKNPNTDIFTLLYTKRLILVEGITEELLIKSYLLTKKDLNDIKVLSFHKGFTKIIDIWKKVNRNSENKLGIVRDFDNQPRAQANHEKQQSNQIIVRTTKGYTLETDIVRDNYKLLKEKYGDECGWNNMNASQIQEDWRNNMKSDLMLRISQDLQSGELNNFVMPSHIKKIIDFMQGNSNES